MTPGPVYEYRTVEIPTNAVATPPTAKSGWDIVDQKIRVRTFAGIERASLVVVWRRKLEPLEAVALRQKDAT